MGKEDSCKPIFRIKPDTTPKALLVEAINEGLHTALSLAKVPSYGCNPIREILLRSKGL